MYNTSNPAELYPSTTWELLATDKYLKTTTGTPLSTGGSNSFTISKANLPAEKLQIDSFSVTTQPHTHPINAFCHDGKTAVFTDWNGGNQYIRRNATSTGGGQNTGTASPSTQNMGSGTPISINPEHITIKAWKRLS